MLFKRERRCGFFFIPVCLSSEKNIFCVLNMFLIDIITFSTPSSEVIRISTWHIHFWKLVWLSYYLCENLYVSGKVLYRHT